MLARFGQYRIELGADRLEWSYDPTTDELNLIVKGNHEISRDRFVVVTGLAGCLEIIAKPWTELKPED